MADPDLPMSTDEALKGLAARAADFGREPQNYASAELILEEGQQNDALWILLSGSVRLSKRGPDGHTITLDDLGPGSLLGILSFWTGEPAFSRLHALTETECLKMSREQFDQAVLEDPEFSQWASQLLVANLSERYRHVVGLNLQVEGLSRELQEEQNALRAALLDLEKTRNQMVHREKLATMGQLLAGIAHEINNPSSSLMKSVAQVEEVLPEVLAGNPDHLRLFTAGQTAEYLGAGASRDRMAELLARYPKLSRPLARRLAHFSDETLASVATQLQAGDLEELEKAAKIFDLGTSLRSIRLANDRITRLVKGLKSYSRQDDVGDTTCKLQECVQDTLMILNHRLKAYDVRVSVPDLGEISGHAGEINQVLTNLITNACDATPPGKVIDISAGSVNHMLWLEVADEGQGLPKGLEEKIFEPNVTTKSGGGQYGLGLGLAISRDLIQQRDGTLTAHNREGGGAVFRVEVPCITG